MAITNLTNEKFEFRGMNHTATMAKKLEDTVEFYCGKLGMKLVCNMKFPGGNHFFIDVGNGVDVLAFVSFDGSEPPDFPIKMGLPLDVPGVARSDLFEGGVGKSAIGSLNRMVFDVPLELLEVYREKLIEKAVECTPIAADGPARLAFYFKDPDEVVVGMGAYRREFNATDVRHQPRTQADLMGSS